MKIRFLGTGAADWNIEERKDGDFFRRLSSLLVNDDLLIDPGPHFSKFAHLDHKRLSARLSSFGMIAAYDGLEIEF